jgi:DNA-binding winged helix-turn-helix (wHTH) protein
MMDNCFGTRVAMPPGRIQLSDDVELDRRAGEPRHASEPLKIRRIPMDFLLLLVEQRGRLVTRDKIVERVSGNDVFTGSFINAARRKSRRVPEDNFKQPRFEQTIAGMGYRFMARLGEINPRQANLSAEPSRFRSVRSWRARTSRTTGFC